MDDFTAKDDDVEERVVLYASNTAFLGSTTRDMAMVIKAAVRNYPSMQEKFQKQINCSKNVLMQRQSNKTYSKTSTYDRISQCIN